MHEPIRIAILDDAVTERGQYGPARALLDDHPMFEVTFGSPTTEDYRTQAGDLPHDIALVDLFLGGDRDCWSSLDLVLELARARGPRPVVRSRFTDSFQLQVCLAAGAWGVIDKDELDLLPRMLQKIATKPERGLPELSRELRNQLRKVASLSLDPTPLRVLDLYVDGFSPREIAEELDRAPKYVHNLLSEACDAFTAVLRHRPTRERMLRELKSRGAGRGVLTWYAERLGDPA